MANIRTYIEESVDELTNKVSWPTWTELQSSGIVVLVATFIVAGLVYLMDLGFGQLMDLIYLKIFGS
ncbi:MAG: preprotein translocase subunit SecE [Salibacteraceae bacterium]|jgi:preprotein translocase subunit SecE|nr:preprotein translocase subunit SecE [Salibacteraceae bacterium]MDP4687154.1 preprotein translocase subunit SecE [Salibacteraceae bacterium]MDP4763815.1 preprotein translocase subunit SecE [Salibacteraceae bacterium]MDP4845269.1 preprotein translocase subunit SecE [Salibacteraceae bacterium]MDP4933223.1 preprotein translocase subunit SecE [Salibacteraceae bacterium]